MAKIKTSKELTSYIQNALKKGHSEEAITYKLEEAGHQDQIIHNHFKHIRNKKIYGISILILSLSVLVVFLLVFAKNQEAKEQQPVPETIQLKDATICNKQPTEIDRQACLLEASYKEKISEEEDLFLRQVSSEEDCINLKDYANAVCLDIVALADIKLISGCEKLRTQFWKEFCKGVVNYNLAIELGNPKLCESIILPYGMRNNCMGEFK